MPLLQATLTAAMLPHVTPATFPTSTLDSSTKWGDAYNTYAIIAQSCIAVTPTLVMLATLKTALKAAFDAALAGASVATTANSMANAYAAYWTGALFGATGIVTLIPGTVALKASLESYFNTQAAADPGPTPAQVASSLSGFLDVFTKLVQVTDASIPCTAPII